jgi:serine/threonine-protein kinase
LLTDFGLVKILEDPTSITQSGVGVGTPNYMAPEQVRGDPVDPRADLYALGAMLYQMLTGQLPFQAESGLAVALKHINEPVTPPREVNPDLPPAVEQVIIKALEKERDARYQSADEFVAAFREALSGESTDHRRPAPLKVQPSRPVTASRFRVAQAHATPTPAPDEIPLDQIWPPEDAKARTPGGGNGWGLLVAIIGALVTFFLLFWGLASGLGALLVQLP